MCWIVRVGRAKNQRRAPRCARSAPTSHEQRRRTLHPTPLASIAGLNGLQVRRSPKSAASVHWCLRVLLLFHQRSWAAAQQRSRPKARSQHAFTDRGSAGWTERDHGRASVDATPLELELSKRRRRRCAVEGGALKREPRARSDERFEPGPNAENRRRRGTNPHGLLALLRQRGVVDDEKGVGTAKHRLRFVPEYLLDRLSFPRRLAHEMPQLLLLSRSDPRRHRLDADRNASPTCSRLSHVAMEHVAAAMERKK
jgi:hypothetical protein